MAEEKEKDLVDKPKQPGSVASGAKKEDEKEAIMMAKLRHSARPSTQEHLGTHTVVAGDSLSAIAKKFYGSAEKEKWMAIYEANKELIGDNPSAIRPGQELKIPKLTD